MTATWLYRRDFPMPYQESCPFPPCAIVQIKNVYGESRIGPASSFWWGYEVEVGQIGEGVIFKARRLDRRKDEPRQRIEIPRRASAAGGGV